MPLSSASLYVHIPFCHKKCSYCDFFSVTQENTNEGNLYRTVLSETLNQIKYFLVSCGFPEIETLYIGGGTPTSLPSGILNRFLSDVRNLIPRIHGEFTVEVNPENVTQELLQILEKRGVTRLSMGVQSLNDNVLKILGRNTDSERTRSALACIDRHWPGQKNFDIITGIPGQNMEEALSDIKSIAAFDPGHISLYSLTFEAGTPLYRKLNSGNIKRLPEDVEIAMYEASLNLLESAGYNRYEVSNFSKTGFESVHNLRYWEMKPYFGSGPAGVSTIPGRSGPVRVENPKNIDLFLGGEENKWGWVYEKIAPPSFFIEHLMMGFRLVRGINVQRIKQVFSVDLQTVFPRTLHRWEPFLHQNGSFLALTRNGLNLLNSFLSDLLNEFDPLYIKTCTWP